MPNPRATADTSAPSPPPVVAPEDVPLRGMDWVWLAIPGLIWGTSFYLIAIGLESFPPMLITWARVVLGMTVAWSFRATREPVPAAARPRLVVLAVFWMVIPLTLFPLAEQRVSSSVTGMLNGANPIFAAIVAAVIVRSLPPARQIIGLAIGLAGVVLIALPTWSEGASSVVGIVLILLALSCYGVAINLAGPLQRAYGALAVIGRSLAVAAVVLAPFGLYALRTASFSWRSLIAVGLLGCVGTGVAFGVMASNAGRYGGTRASSTTYLIPGVSIVLGVFVHGEPLHAIALVGSLIALVGAYLVNTATKSPTSVERNSGTNAEATTLSQ